MVSILAIVETNGEQEPALALQWEKWLNRKGLWDRERCSGRDYVSLPWTANRGRRDSNNRSQATIIRFLAHTDGKH